jgi:hypothetical protein
VKERFYAASAPAASMIVRSCAPRSDDGGRPNVVRKRSQKWLGE